MNKIINTEYTMYNLIFKIIFTFLFQDLIFLFRGPDPIPTPKPKIAQIVIATP